MSSESEVTDSTEPAPSTTERAETTADRGNLGKYLLQKPIGSGGMGTVYLALDPELNRVVALKILPKEKAVNPGLVKRFRQEAQSAAQLKHDNIVAVYDAGKADGYLYIALEYVDGTDVAQLIKQRGSLPIRRSVEIVKQVAHALEHAFRRGIVHRDIKPSNMLIKRDGTVKLADMGLARSVDESLDSGVTRVGTTVGTVDYMAPEQARDSKSADIRSDIYSLGCAWYHMLTGQAPFPKGSITNKLYAHIAKPRPDPRKHNERIPESIAATVRRMMARSPKERYQTPAELLEQLERVSSRPDPASEKFLSALSDAVDTVTSPAKPASRSTPDRKTSADRKGKSTARSTRSTPAAEMSQTLPQRPSPRKKSDSGELMKVMGLLFAGLLGAALIWWIITLAIPPAPTSPKDSPSPFSRIEESMPAESKVLLAATTLRDRAAIPVAGLAEGDPA